MNYDLLNTWNFKQEFFRQNARLKQSKSENGPRTLPAHIKARTYSIYSLDATDEDGSFGRLLNHSVNGNVKTIIVNIGGKPALVFVAKTNIRPNTELCYDYGERNKDVINAHPWLSL